MGMPKISGQSASTKLPSIEPPKLGPMPNSQNSKPPSSSSSNTGSSTVEFGSSRDGKAAEVSFDNAKLHGKQADDHLDKFKSEREKYNHSAGGNHAPGSGKMMHHVGHTIMNRQKEYNELTNFSNTSDVSTKKDGAVFWSGNTLDDNGKIKHSAMHTAQHYAQENGKTTLEMTDGGKKLHYYDGDYSFKKLNERFEYAKDPNDRSEAGKLWNNMSDRFVDQAQGDVTAVHAASKDDPYFTSGHSKKSVWESIEKPTLEARGQKINELYADDLKDNLKPYGEIGF